MSAAQVSGLNHLTFAVSNLDASLQFYTDVLNAKLEHRWTSGAYLTLGPIWVCLEHSEVTPRIDDTHIALSSSHYDSLTQKITQRAKLWKNNTSEGRSIYFLDPDGHKFELHEGSLASRLSSYNA